MPIPNPTDLLSQRVKLVEVTYYGTNPDHRQRSPKMAEQRTIFVEPRITPAKLI